MSTSSDTSTDHPSAADTRLVDLIRVYDDALPAALCAKIVDLFEADPDGQFRRAKQNTWTEYTITRRSNPDWADVERTLISCMLQHLKEYARMPAARSLGRSAPRAFEQFMMKKYECERAVPDHFPQHVDAYDIHSAVRLLGFLWYLNDVEEGGETEFSDLGVSIPPRAGRLVLLPPTWMYPHDGRPPVSGPKYIITSYLNFRDVDDDVRFAYPLR